MAKSKTKQAEKRRLARVWAHVDDAMSLLALTHATFALYHPDYAQAIEAIGIELAIVQSQLEDLWLSAWGELPTNMRSWT